MTTERRPAPAITLKAASTGRTVTLNKMGVPLVLIFASQGTTERVDPFRTAVRERFPDPQKVVIASIVDMHAVPRLMRKMAEGALGTRYKEVAGRLGPGKDPKEYVVILPDWKGEVASLLGVGEVEENLGIAVITAGGELSGVYKGDEPLKATTELLERAGA